MSAVPTATRTNHHDDFSGGEGGTANDHGGQDMPQDANKNGLPKHLPLPFEYRTVIPWWEVALVTTTAIPLRVLELVLRRKHRDRILHPWMDAKSLTMKELFDHIRGWKALAALYDQRVLEGEPDIQRMLAWYQVAPAQSVRNRLLLVEHLLDKAIAERYQATRQTVRLISLACGSAVAMLRAIKRANEQGIPARALLVDHDESSLCYAMAIAEDLGIAQFVETQQGNVLEFFAGPEAPVAFDICEMVGLLDYLNRKQAIRLMRQIRERLPSGGVFLTANVSRNWGHMAFVRAVMRWWMIHRNEGQVAQLLLAGGFSGKKLRFYSEPHDGHHIVWATK